VLTGVALAVALSGCTTAESRTDAGSSSPSSTASRSASPSATASASSDSTPSAPAPSATSDPGDTSTPSTAATPTPSRDLSEEDSTPQDPGSEEPLDDIDPADTVDPTFEPVAGYDPLLVWAVCLEAATGQYPDITDWWDYESSQVTDATGSAPAGASPVAVTIPYGDPDGGSPTGAVSCSFTGPPEFPTVSGTTQVSA